MSDTQQSPYTPEEVEAYKMANLINAMPEPTRIEIIKNLIMQMDAMEEAR